MLQEGKTSLEVFLDVCKERGIELLAKRSGRFVLRLNPEVHQKAIIKVKVDGKSLNEWVNSVLASAVC